MVITTANLSVHIGSTHNLEAVDDQVDDAGLGPCEVWQFHDQRIQSLEY